MLVTTTTTSLLSKVKQTNNNEKKETCRMRGRRRETYIYLNKARGEKGERGEKEGLRPKLEVN